MILGLRPRLYADVATDVGKSGMLFHSVCSREGINTGRRRQA